jgi:hypothetical protein
MKEGEIVAKHVIGISGPNPSTQNQTYIPLILSKRMQHKLSINTKDKAVANV